MMTPSIVSCEYLFIIIYCLNLSLIIATPISYPQNSSIVFNVNNSIIFAVDPDIFNRSTPFQHNKLICDPNLPCTIFCEIFEACYNSTIICPVNHQCNIICSGSNSCKRMDINSPQNHSLLNIKATGYNALSLFVYPPYPVDDYIDFQLNCGSQFQFQCYNMDVICPAYAKCTINCVGYFACGNVKSLCICNAIY